MQSPLFFIQLSSFHSIQFKFFLNICCIRTFESVLGLFHFFFVFNFWSSRWEIHLDSFFFFVLSSFFCDGKNHANSIINVCASAYCQLVSNCCTNKNNSKKNLNKNKGIWVFCELIPKDFIQSNNYTKF